MRTRIAAVLVMLVAVAMIGQVQAQPALTPRPIPYGFPPVNYPSLEFADLEEDGDLDLVLTGNTPNGPLMDVYLLADSVISPVEGVQYIIKVFHPLNFRDHAVSSGAARLGDYDGDGDKDLLLTGLADYVEGRNQVLEPTLKIYENDWPPQGGLGGFSSPFDVSFVFPGLYRSAAAWGDYDLDGDLDFVAAGLPSLTATAPVTRLYRNTSGAFEAVPTDLPGVMDGDLAWGDYDGDGDPDLALMGDTSGGTYVMRVYRNDGGQLVDIGLDAPRIAHGSLEWGDYDDDGDLDLLATGMRLDPRFLVGVTEVLRNEGGTLTMAPLGLEGWGLGEAGWGDADRDGDLDLFVVGSPRATAPPTFRLYTFDGSSYNKTWEYTGNRFSALAVGDYNGDGDADVVVAGELTLGIQIRFFMNWDYPECAIPWVEGDFKGNC